MLLFLTYFAFKFNITLGAKLFISIAITEEELLSRLHVKTNATYTPPTVVYLISKTFA